MKLFPVDLASCNFQTHPFRDGEPGHVGPAPRPAHDWHVATWWHSVHATGDTQSQASHHGLQIKQKCGSHRQYVCAEICSHLWTATCPISQNVSLKTRHQLTSTSHQLHICLRQNEAWKIIKCHNKKGQKAAMSCLHLDGVLPPLKRGHQN